MAPIVRTVIDGFPKRHVVGVLIVRFPVYQQRNVNLQKGRSSNGGPTASLMIKLEKNAEREKRIGAIGVAHIPLMGDLPDL